MEVWGEGWRKGANSIWLLGFFGSLNVERLFFLTDWRLRNAFKMWRGDAHGRSAETKILEWSWDAAFDKWKLKLTLGSCDVLGTFSYHPGKWIFGVPSDLWVSGYRSPSLVSPLFIERRIIKTSTSESRWYAQSTYRLLLPIRVYDIANSWSFGPFVLCLCRCRSSSCQNNVERRSLTFVSSCIDRTWNLNRDWE